MSLLPSPKNLLVYSPRKKRSYTSLLRTRPVALTRSHWKVRVGTHKTGLSPHRIFSKLSKEQIPNTSCMQEKTYNCHFVLKISLHTRGKNLAQLSNLGETNGVQTVGTYYCMLKVWGEVSLRNSANRVKVWQGFQLYSQRKAGEKARGKLSEEQIR